MKLLNIQEFLLEGNDDEKFTIEKNKNREITTHSGTLEQLKTYYNSTLLAGKSWEKEKDCVAINTSPSNISALVKSLNDCAHNTAGSKENDTKYRVVPNVDKKVSEEINESVNIEMDKCVKSFIDKISNDSDIKLSEAVSAVQASIERLNISEDIKTEKDEECTCEDGNDEKCDYCKEKEQKDSEEVK